jgi:MoaA/NifB/PqqE/SkfB family radical SAM enzyme
VPASPDSSFLRHALTFVRGRVPAQLIVQLTDACNAACPQCGMRRNAPFRRTLLSLDDGKRIIDHAAASGVAAISFTGGEPFLHVEELLTLIRYASDAGIRYTRTGTNGFLFMNPDGGGFTSRVSHIAKSLAASGLYTFWISIDSHRPEVHEAMRGLPGVVKGIERALPIFHAHGVYPSANLGITKALLQRSSGRDPSGAARREEYREGFRAFFRSVVDLGFTIANACYPMNIGEASSGTLSAVYGATAANDLVTFKREEKAVMFRALRETIPEFRSRIRIFSPLSSLLAMERRYGEERDLSRPCRGGADFFFIDAQGSDAYPCGYRGGENLGKFWELNISRQPAPAECRECDWECFRDPSELMGPFHELFSSPAGLLAKLLRDRLHTSLWLDDLRYYRAADFFNGRRPPDFRKLRRFSAAGAA